MNCFIERDSEQDINYILDKFPGTRRAMCNWGDNCYSLVIKEERIVALASCFRKKREVNGVLFNEDWINLSDVFSDEDKRKGFGTALINTVNELAKEKGNGLLAAYIDINDLKSMSFFTKNGFTLLPITDAEGNQCGKVANYLV